MRLARFQQGMGLGYRFKSKLVTVNQWFQFAFVNDARDVRQNFSVRCASDIF